MESPSRRQYVFVDFENVPEVDPAVFGEQSMHLTLLVGAKQPKLSVPLVEKLLAHADSVNLVRLATSGRNALDFTLAYYLGRAAAADPGGEFHIISKDGGFDSLVEHLRSRKLHVRRHPDFTTLLLSPEANSAAPPPAPKPPAPPKKKAAAKPAPKAQDKPAPVVKPAAFSKDLLSPTLEHFRTHPNNRPKSRTTLITHLVSHYGKKSTEAEVVRLVDTMVRHGHLKIDDKDKVSFKE